MNTPTPLKLFATGTRIGRWIALFCASVMIITSLYIFWDPSIVLQSGLNLRDAPSATFPSGQRLLGILILILSLQYIAMSKVFALMYAFAQALSERGKIQSQEGIALLRRLTRSSLWLFWAELVCTAVFASSPYRNAFFGYTTNELGISEFLWGVWHFLPNLTGGACLVAALLFAVIREALEKNLGLQQELDLTV
jgi:hypothetical protein